MYLQNYYIKGGHLLVWNKDIFINGWYKKKNERKGTKKGANYFCNILSIYSVYIQHAVWYIEIMLNLYDKLHYNTTVTFPVISAIFICSIVHYTKNQILCYALTHINKILLLM